MTSFTNFSALPTELRFQIWHEAQQLFPRIVEARRSWTGDDDHFTPHWTVKPTAKPTLLAVNQEARSELMTCYCAPFAAAHIITPPNTTANDLLICLSEDELFLISELKPYRRIDIFDIDFDPLQELFQGHQEKVLQELRCLILQELLWFGTCLSGAPSFKRAIGKLFLLERFGIVRGRDMLDEQIKLGSFENLYEEVSLDSKESFLTIEDVLEGFSGELKVFKPIPRR